jgi:DNA-binding transcriptional LysR family regulator
MREIETRLFRYFVALADEQHFGRAALNLSISPPTLTHQIQKLEAHVGVKLVERRGNTHLVLTEAGRRFLSRARNVLREAREAEAAAQQAARGETGRLEIGFMAVVSMSGMVAKFIGGFQKKYPGIELILRSAVTNDQISAILAGTLDFGFVRAPDHFPIGVKGFIVSRQPMVLAMPSSHPLARRKSIDPSALKGERFINTSPDLDVGFWRHLHAVGTLGDFTPNVVRRAKDVMGMLSYVSAGQGVAAVSSAFMKMAMPNVTFRPFDTAEPLTAPIAFVYRENQASPAGKAFIDFMDELAIAP